MTNRIRGSIDALRRRRIWMVIPALLLSAILVAPAVTSAQEGKTPESVYFPETGHHLSHAFLDYWRHEGGLMTFGYPITEEIVDASTGLTVQYFERAVLEYHPDAGEGWNVLQRLVGNEELATLEHNAAFDPIANGSNDSNCTFYAPTGHRLCFGFRDYWQNNGGLRIFGYPITEEYNDPVTGYTVQYFERARFEYHPENPAGFQVLMGLLGQNAAQRDGVDTSAVAKDSAPNYDSSLFPVERCHSWQLDLDRGESSAAAGTVGVDFSFTNTSLQTCALEGYPGMLMLDASGEPMPTNVIWGGGTAVTDVAPVNVVLDRGDSASFTITYANIPTGDQSHDAACPASDRLLVTPPDAYDSLVIQTMISPCEGDIYASPVVPGTSGPLS